MFLSTRFTGRDLFCFYWYAGRLLRLGWTLALINDCLKRKSSRLFQPVVGPNMHLPNIFDDKSLLYASTNEGNFLEIAVGAPNLLYKEESIKDQTFRSQNTYKNLNQARFDQRNSYQPLVFSVASSTNMTNNSVWFYEPFYDFDRFFDEAFNAFNQRLSSGDQVQRRVTDGGDASAGARALRPRYVLV